jgi:hypothetical protein
MVGEREGGGGPLCFEGGGVSSWLEGEVSWWEGERGRAPLGPGEMEREPVRERDE